MIVAKVQQKRQKHPRMGARKLHNLLRHELEQEGCAVGRDTLLDILRENNLLVERCRSAVRTTFGGMWRCPNLMSEQVISRPNQVWVADITYLRTPSGFLYLALITDAYSRRIMGYDVSASLSLEGAERALRRAVRTAGGKAAVAGLIHHSDHGVQYTSHSYRALLAHYGARSSMGEVGNCYDNALAERVNGILKIEYLLHYPLVNLAHAQQAVKESIWLYNHERPHNSLGLRMPFDVYMNGGA